MMAKYRGIVRGMGAGVEILTEVDPSVFMDWLRSELETLEGHVNHGRDFGASVSFRTLNAFLVEANCDHVMGLDLSDVDHL